MKEMTPPLIAVTSNLISASAGTGKTYQLASRFVALLALGYKAEEMIALTFTRKAAGEFRNRILKALSDGALDLDDKGTPRSRDKHGRLQGRNAITVRVWETWSGLTIKDGTAIPAGNSVALCPPAAEVVQLAAQAGLSPEELYATDDRLYQRLKLPRLTADTYRHLLADVVNAMSRLTLSTLDSFFNRIVRSNSLTIGIRDIVPMEPEDTEAERRTVLRELLAELSSTSSEGQFFLEQFEKLTGGEGKNMMNYLHEQIQSYLTLYRNINTPEAWGNATAFNLPPAETEVSISPEQWKSYTDELERLHQEQKEAASALTAKAAAAIPALLKDLQNSNFSFLHKHTSPTSANAGSKFNKFYEAAKCCAADHKLAECMERIIAHAREAHLQSIIRKTQALFYILNRYATAYLNHMRSTGRVGFDDIAMFAYHLMKENGNSSAEERDYAANRITYNLDASYKHWMLDEFQDTSEMQFATLAPVLNEIAQGERHADSGAAERSIFVVGDEKQSIYGFRTGETEVFRKLRTETPWKETLHPSSLEKSFRSSPEIMGQNGFINNMFLALNKVEQEITTADNNELQKLDCAELLTYDERLSKTFTHHHSATAKSGYVRISSVPGQSSSEETRYAFYDSIAELLDNELTNDNGAPLHGMSIAILTRNNNEARELESRLCEKLPRLPILRLGDEKTAATSQLGELLLSFFMWLHHPDDLYRAGLVKASPMEVLFCRPTSADKELAPRDYNRRVYKITHEYWCHRLELQGYAAVVRAMLDCFPTEPQNLRNGRTAHIWLTEAHAFDCTGGAIDEWISHIGKAGAAAAASSRYVQIMTMHKSKGLEFDAVILPYIAESAEDELDNVSHFNMKDACGDIEGLLLSPGNAEKRDAWKEVFAPLCAAKKQHERKEAYNLLYVAATRAKHANYIFCNGSSLIDENSKKTRVWKGIARSTGGMLRRMLQHPIFSGTSMDADSIVCDIPEPRILWQSGNAHWYEDSAFIRDNDRQNSPASLPNLPQIPRHRRRHKSPSQLAPAEDKRHEENSPAPQPPTYDGNYSAADFGTAVHACFEQITWLHESCPAWLTAPITPEQQVVAASLRQPQVQALFTRQPGQEVYNEQAIEAISAHDEWISGTIDRLVLTHDSSGNITAAHIIDYKTNKPEQREGYVDFYAWLMAHYQPQMRQYRELIAQAFELPLERVSVSLISCPQNFAKAPARVLSYTAEQSERTAHFCQQELPGLL